MPANTRASEVAEKGNSRVWMVKGVRGHEPSPAGEPREAEGSLPEAAAAASGAIAAAASGAIAASGAGAAAGAAVADAPVPQGATAATAARPASSFVWPSAPTLRLLGGKVVVSSEVFVFGTTLGQGSFGMVRQALHKPSGFQVAVKVFKDCGGRRSTDFALQEAYIADKGRGHPHFVSLLDAFLCHMPNGVAHPCLVYEIWGQSLADLLRGNPLSAAAIRTTAEHLFRAARFLHDRGLVHTDIKPANVLVAGAGGPDILAKLADYGSVDEAMAFLCV